ncbi:MAG: tripartite tricarboxylate transporter substrate binding protein [Betaproteobacteria bacterium]|nr:tripartite tricarboxylate transporter substrate binding protein [Betaproteobacteria bacterium]MBI2959247.1 tripartite tricarboxylate transporter substrate binding protein [Betaproteobacteria bacterium]
MRSKSLCVSFPDAARITLVGAFSLLALALACGQSAAQTYPAKPIRLVVGYSPGGGTDLTARTVAPKLSERLGQPVIVENRPGANATIGVGYVAKADPDGYTLLVGTSAEMVYALGLYERLPYDTTKDFVPVMHMTTNPLIFAVHPSLPVTSIKELIELARAKPGKLFFASGAAHFQATGELFKQQAGVNIVNVSYKGAAPAVTAAVAGEVPLVVSSFSILPQLRAGKLRALAVTLSKRYALLPDIPTMAEAGVPGVEVAPWTGLFAPSGTPRAIIDKLNSELIAIYKLDDVKARFAAQGAIGEPLPLAEFSALLKTDLAKWPSLLRELNISAK